MTLMACKEQSIKTGNPLAKVGSSVLYVDDLPDWVTTNNDSTALKSSYIEQWIRKKSMVRAAEEFLGEEIDIDKLLNDYKESLLMVNLEQQLIKQKMDTFVTNMQVSQYYNEKGDDFLLKEEALKLTYLQCKDSLTIAALKKAWKKKNPLEDLKSIDLGQCSHLWLEKEEWVHKSKITSTLPKSISKKITWNKTNKYDFVLDSIAYFIKIEESIKPRERSPLSLVQENIVKVILHNRRKSLMKDYEDKLIEEGIKSKYITLYNN